MPTFGAMKALALILSLLLSFLFGGDKGGSAVQDGTSSELIVEKPYSDVQGENFSNREMCLTAASGYSFAGNDSTSTPSVRTTTARRRVNQNLRSSFRMVKAGKVVDNNSLFPSSAPSRIVLSGLFDSGRLFLSICRLRL